MRKNTGGPALDDEAAGVNATCADGVGVSEGAPVADVERGRGGAPWVPRVAVFASERDRFPAMRRDGRLVSVASSARFCCTKNQ